MKERIQLGDIFLNDDGYMCIIDYFEYINNDISVHYRKLSGGRGFYTGPGFYMIWQLIHRATPLSNLVLL